MVHKETFFQRAESGIPSSWVVFYWPEDCNPAYEAHSAQYFNSPEDAEDFEATLTGYDDWYTGQEESLATQ